MLEWLKLPIAANAVKLLRSNFVGFLDEVELSDHDDRNLADSLTTEGVLFKKNPVGSIYRMDSPLLDGFIRNNIIPKLFSNSPRMIPPHGVGGPDVLGILIESLKFFDKDLIQLAAIRSYKTSKVKIASIPDSHVPRESVYDTELMRILANWLRPGYNWTVTGQWHLQSETKAHKFTDIVLKKKGDPTIVLELLATGDRSFVQSHIQKTPEYMKLLSADEAWVVHFTCEKDYKPIWQSEEELSHLNVNVVHFVHNLEFTDVVMNVRWKDRAGTIHKEERQLIV